MSSIKFPTGGDQGGAASAGQAELERRSRSFQGQPVTFMPPGPVGNVRIRTPPTGLTGERCPKLTRSRPPPNRYGAVRSTTAASPRTMVRYSSSARCYRHVHAAPRSNPPLAAFHKTFASASTNLILVAVMREPVALADSLLVRSPSGTHPHPPHRCPHVVSLFAGIDGNPC